MRQSLKIQIKGDTVKNQVLKTTDIRYLMEGKEVARGVVEYIEKEGLVERVYKYENPQTGHLVKFSTLVKRKLLPEDIIEKLRTCYPTQRGQEIIDRYNSVDVELSVKPAVVLRRGVDKFIKRCVIEDDYTHFDIVKREYRIEIEISNVDFVSYSTDEELLAAVADKMKECLKGGNNG